MAGKDHLLLPNLIQARAHGWTHAGTGRAHTAARSKALSGWRPGIGSADTDTLYDLPRLRAQSRDLNRNDAIAAGATLTAVTGAIGTGLTLQPRPDRKYLGLDELAAEDWIDNARRRFDFWAGSDACDADRRFDFYNLQSLARRSALDSGDAFLVRRAIARPGRANQLALKLIEADRVSNPDGIPNSDTLIEGVQFEDGAPVGIHVCNRHPGDLYTSSKTRTWEYIPMFGPQSGRRLVVHLFAVNQTLRPEQTRGLPWLAPVIQPLKQLGEFTDAELQSTVNAALQSFFVTMEQDAYQATFGSTSDLTDAERADYLRSCMWDGEIEAGRTIRLLPGEQVHTPQFSHPNAGLDPFMAAILKRVGAALGLPFEVLIQSFNASYSASRAALLRAWQMYKLWRMNDASCLCDPVYDWFLTEEISLGRIRAPGYFVNDDYRAAWAKASWIGDGPGSIDPSREVAAARERVALTISTLEAESEAYDGLPWEDKANQRIKEAKKLAEMPAPAPATAAPAPTQANSSTEMAAVLQALADITDRLERIEARA